VDEILSYLLGDLGALKACSLTCKRLLGATRPLIHQRLACFDSRSDHPKPKVSLFSCRKKDPGVFDRLIDADRSGILPYTQHLIFQPKYHYSDPRFTPSDLQEYSPYLRSITKLHTLTLDSFYLPQFIPVFDEYFGVFTNTLRHLDIRRAYGTEQQLLYIVCQFPLLEDLSIGYSRWERAEKHPAPVVTQSPPLRGKLILARPVSKELSDGLMAFPGGLNFHSLELFRCGNMNTRAILAACGHTAASVSYFWHSQADGGESSPSIQVYTVM